VSLREHCRITVITETVKTETVNWVTVNWETVKMETGKTTLGKNGNWNYGGELGLQQLGLTITDNLPDDAYIEKFVIFFL